MCSVCHYVMLCSSHSVDFQIYRSWMACCCQQLIGISHSNLSEDLFHQNGFWCVDLLWYHLQNWIQMKKPHLNLCHLPGKETAVVQWRNSSGPMTDPWGTPDMTLQGLEAAQLTITVWVRPVRQACNHCPSFPEILSCFNFPPNRMPWQSPNITHQRYHCPRGFSGCCRSVI